MTRHLLSATASAALLCLPAAVHAQSARTQSARTQSARTAPASEVSEIVVTAARLDAARSTIEPALGATTYSLPEQFITDLPGGANIQLSQVILQTPGVSQDGFGQLHVRGDHGDTQYRLNNVILPEGLEVFGQSLSTRLASDVQLVTGALPAQYGLRTAGIINIVTKSGFKNGGEASLYGGGHGVITPSLEYGGSFGRSSAFGSLSYTGTNVGIESPDGRARPLHDHSDQFQGFAYLDHILDDSSRLSMIVGASRQSFEIPNVAGLQPELGLTVNGQTAFASDDLDQRQREGTTYATGTYLRTSGELTLQLSVFARRSTLEYTPDLLGELLFNGLAQAARKTDLAVGLQAEGAYRLNERHTVRAGLILQHDHTTGRTSSRVLPVDDAGVQTTDQPLVIDESDRLSGAIYSAFLQDEWTLSDGLTLNYGLRFDRLAAFRDERQLSPRVNLVWSSAGGTTIHAGYARYFTPPSFELVASETLTQFIGTTAQAPDTRNDLPRSERTNYFDVGAEQKWGPLTFGVDTYYRKADYMVDVGQFGAPIILTPFNYRVGYARGVELSANYSSRALTAYANLAVAEVRGRGVVSSQFNFSPDDLAYFQDHYFPLDHDQTYTASGGAAYRVGATRISGDVLYGSGLRRDGATPNGAKLPAYTQVNLSVSQEIRTSAGPLTVRADLINALDRKYAIRDGSGVGVGAPQFGPRRGFFMGVSKEF